MKHRRNGACFMTSVGSHNKHYGTTVGRRHGRNSVIFFAVLLTELCHWTGCVKTTLTVTPNKWYISQNNTDRDSQQVIHISKQHWLWLPTSDTYLKTTLTVTPNKWYIFQNNTDCDSQQVIHISKQHWLWLPSDTYLKRSWTTLQKHSTWYPP
jgi:hypothetical protein